MASEPRPAPPPATELLLRPKPNRPFPHSNGMLPNGTGALSLEPICCFIVSSRPWGVEFLHASIPGKQMTDLLWFNTYFHVFGYGI